MKNVHLLFSILLIYSLVTYGQKVANIKQDAKLGEPGYTYLNLNNISTTFFNDGLSDTRSDPNGGPAFKFPKSRDKHAVYASGLVWGFLVPTTPNLRVGGSTYRTGLQGGKIINSGLPWIQLLSEDPNDYHVRIYRVRSDVYPGGPWVDLSEEAIDEGKTEQEVRDQYELDWIEWRAEDGAPFKDVDGNGLYNSIVDIPGVEGASQTIWFVANDLDEMKTISLYGTQPGGIEIQATLWNYKNPGFLGNMLFRKYKLINKSNTLFSDMYISMWADPDLGDYKDDLAGCDTLLNLGYSINGYDFDAVYDPLPPPAIGLKLLKGPVTEEGIVLPMTAFYFFNPDDNFYGDPQMGDATGGGWLYNFFQGRYGSTPFIVPGTTLETTYALSGDPLTGEGWIDGLISPPGDRRIGLASGPVQMVPGDTQEVVIAEIAALGSNRLNSFRTLKYYSSLVEEVFNSGLNISSPPVPPSPEITINDTGSVINFDWSRDTLLISQIENFNQDGYSFEGYNIYQMPFPEPIFESAVKVATYDKVNGITSITGIIMDPETGLPITGNQQSGSDSGIKRNFSTNYDYIEDAYMIVGKKYYFAVTAYTHNSDAQIIPHSSETPIKILEVTHYENLPGPDYGDSIQVAHSQGSGDGNIYVTVDNPARLTGNNYEVYFEVNSYYRNENGEWVLISGDNKSNLNKPDDLTGSSLSAGAVYGETAGTTEIKFVLDIVSSTNSWADGILLTFPPSIQILNALPCPTGQGYMVVPVINHSANTVLYGNNNVTQNGYFVDGEQLTVIVGTTSTPMIIDYIIYDDGYGQPVINAIGSVLIDDIGYEFKTQQEWFLKNLSTQNIVLNHQTVINGYDLYTGQYVGDPVADGIKITADINYNEPIGFSNLNLFSPTGQTILTSNGSNNTLDIQNYTIFGVPTSKVIDNFGVGTNDVYHLVQDYELRFTGVYSSMVINGQTVYYVSSGGQMATIFRMLNANSLAQHPLNPNPGIAQPFLLRIPFEVWNVEDPNNSYQVNLTFRDRERIGNEDPFWAWNPINRMYSIIVNSSYDPNQIIQIDNGPDPFNDLATWILVHYGTNYHLNDVVKVTYSAPIEPGTDKFTFTTPNPIVSVKNESVVKNFNLYQNYPNPFNPSTTISFDLPKQGLVKLEIFNILGERVAELINTELFAGKHQINFNGAYFASGVYFYRLKAGDFVQAKKMIYLK